jgi:hypothetical protein
VLDGGVEVAVLHLELGEALVEFCWVLDLHGVGPGGEGSADCNSGRAAPQRLQ